MLHRAENISTTAKILFHGAVLDNDQERLLISQRGTTRHYVSPDMMQQVYTTTYDIVLQNKQENKA